MNDEITRTLKYGCAGEDVKYIQYVSGLNETGNFDKTTREMIREFQIKSGLDVTGELEPKMINKFLHYCIGSCTDESLSSTEEDS